MIPCVTFTDYLKYTLPLIMVIKNINSQEPDDVGSNSSFIIYSLEQMT